MDRARASEPYLPPRSGRASLRRHGRRAIPLVRRGVHHGWALEHRRPHPVDLEDAEVRASARGRWERDEPIHLPGALTQPLREHQGDIRRSRSLFERLRRGASFQDEVWARLGEASGLRPAGAAIDLNDPREIEKVFADAVPSGRVAARDLYAKLSWISHDERDTSLRIRFSFGSEHLLEWLQETRRAPWADRYAEALFSECAAITGHSPLTALVARLIGRRTRFSERIVYSHAPGGGAIFHHDAEPAQLGVLYTQLAGETAWLALPKRTLARELAAAARTPAQRRAAATPSRALRSLDREDATALERLLNRSPRFTGRLVARGHFRRVRAGDVLLLPSHGPDDVAWHSVFALGARPSLAHSYGIFALRPAR